MTELETAIHAARAAGQLLRDNYLLPHEIYYKGTIDIVTEVDRASEGLISDILQGDFPGLGFLGEESINVRDSREGIWVVDPVDGTTNYSRGYPLFAVSIALEKAGQTVLGVVYNPILDELFTAEKGRGAYLNGRSIQVSQIGELGKSLVASGFPYDAWTNPADNGVEWWRFMKRTVSVRSDGCASIDLCQVAAGRLDGYWEIDLEAWDMAAGALIVQEAGGMVTLTSGAPFMPYQRSVLASNGKLHPAMLKLLKSGKNLNYE